MPNWCNTNYIFYADTEVGQQQLKQLYEGIAAAIKPKRRPICSDFGDGWLGNVLLQFCPETLVLSPDNVRCVYRGRDVPFRGSITYISLDDNTLTVTTETAWDPMFEVWDVLLKLCKFTDVRYVYIAEECGAGLFVNTDIRHRFLSERYAIDIMLTDWCETLYFTNAREALAELNGVINQLRYRYSSNPKAYCLPADFDIATLRAQRSVKRAASLIEDSLFPLAGEKISNEFVSVHEYAYR